MATEISREEMDARLATVQAEFRGDMVQLRGDMNAGFAEVRSDMKTGFAELRADMHEANAAISKWMLQTVLAIVGTVFVGLGGLALTTYNALKPAPSPTTQAAPVVILSGNATLDGITSKPPAGTASK